MIRHRSVVVVLLVVGAALCQASPPHIAHLRIGAHRVTAEVADNERTREQGLMGRFNLPENHGMLFVFPDARVMTFWMRDTAIPLSIAFVSRDGQVLNIADMVPRTETVHSSVGKGMYALEMRRGWFADHKIGPGSRITGLAGVASAKD